MMFKFFFMFTFNFRGTKVSVDYQLKYEVLHLPATVLVEYETMLAELLVESAQDPLQSSRHGEQLTIDASRVEDFFKGLVAING